VSTCVSGHGEYSSHTHGNLKSDPRTYYTCIHCGAFDEDGVFEELVDRQTEEAKLRAKIKELEQKNREIIDDSIETLNAGYSQAFDDMSGVTHGVMEVTWASGPAEGLTLILQRLQEKDVPTWTPTGVPYDWLSRWKVELAQ